MREIKFRAWDGRHKKMFENVGHLNGVWYLPNGKRLTTTNAVMQFTNLKDKNGKEIYEGDVFPSTKGNWAVKFGAWDFWTGKNLTPMYGWYGECLTLEGEYHHQLPLTPTSTGEHVEVIGNIYETPELLRPAEA